MPQTWLVTGCSSGFGETFVRQLRRAGDNVIATGRNADVKLAHLKETGATTLDLDVTAPASVIQEKLKQAWDIYPGGIDVVVNNAGYIQSGCVEELTEEEIDQCMRTNFYGPLNITRAVLPSMRARGTGTVVFMSSVGGWIGHPSAAAYGASKFALEGAAESLSTELSLVAPGIKILLFEPGFFRTKVFSKLVHAPPRVEAYAEFNAQSSAYEDGLVGNEPGDADKAVGLMIDFVNGTGVAVGKTLPLRMPIGTDAFEPIRKKCEDTLRICDEWGHIGKLTDIAPPK